MKKMMLSATVLAIVLGLSGCIWPGPHHHHPHHSSGDNRGPQMQDYHHGNQQDGMRR